LLPAGRAGTQIAANNINSGTRLFMEAISVRGLSKSFDYYEKEEGLKNSVKNLFHRERLVREAVRSISFGIEEGEIVGFLGPNGAGKTTTLKMLSGILYPTAGEAGVLGFVPWERKKEFKMNFSIVMGQKSQLWFDLPAVESFRLNKSIYELDEKAYKATLDELTGLLDVRDMLKVQVRRLSLGERMKMELIASLLHRPKIMFLDEPTIGLDIISQQRIRDFIRYYNEQTKTTVILTSHYMNDIEALCKRTILINQGRIVYDGDLRAINDVFSENKILRLKLSESADASVLSRFGTVKSCSGCEATVEIQKDRIKEAAKTILDTLPILDFTIEDIPIEEGVALLYRRQVSE
jgi:ABC-2 type transport system ATP-binding protein